MLREYPEMKLRVVSDYLVYERHGRAAGDVYLSWARVQRG